MDKNSIYGIIVIAAIFIVWGIISKPSEEELAKQKAEKDSLELVQKELEQAREQLKKEKAQAQKLGQASTKTDTNSSSVADTSAIINTNARHGFLSSSKTLNNELYTIENDLVKITLSTKGGKPHSVELKNYKTHDSLPLILFTGDSNIFGFDFYHKKKYLNTNELFFTPSVTESVTKVTDNSKSIAMIAETKDGGQIEYLYTLSPGRYDLDLDINLNRLDGISTRRVGILDLNWTILSPQQEKGRDNEKNYSSLYYKHFEDEVDNFRMRSNKDVQSETINTPLKWIAYKDQFFSSVLISENKFEDAAMKSVIQPENSRYLFKFSSTIGLAYNDVSQTSIPLKFYFGPNKYSLLKDNYGDLELHNLVSVGKSIIKWINQGVIINLFDFLNKYFSNYGIIILIMTVIIKMFLLPLTFKSYMSTAKMRVLKPQIDEINNKIPKEKAMERQQATMALYKKVGVSPLGGCLPMLLQMPILFAMFRFFPSSIELRQEGFLWAHDLSTYDAIVEWSGNIPIISKWYGNHVSLFTVLMTISTIFTMKINSQATSGGQQLPGMKGMMYMMPIMFMFVLNRFSAGLTYYYFLANLITFGQNILFKQFVDEEALLKKLESKKAKPRKKSNFQKRLEEMSKQQQKGMKRK